MIKNIYYIAMALIAGMMVSCDPITESDPGISANLTEADLQARVALTQTTAGQNKFTFSTNPTLTVQVLDQDGAILATGTEGSIIGTPPLTSLTVRAMNQDGSITSFSNDVTISEYVDVPSIYEGLLKMIDIRYRLLSYIYSSAWQVTANSRIMMRGLAMDFAADPKVYDIDDSYMFGPSFLVHPVTSSNDCLSTYLPDHTGKYWFDFYDHTLYEGGQTITQNVPIDKIPIFVKAGSIVPFNEVKQYATEKADDMMDIYVFAGEDAEFELYEDDNETYTYEKGEYSVIRFNWNEKAQVLTCLLYTSDAADE